MDINFLLSPSFLPLLLPSSCSILNCCSPLHLHDYRLTFISFSCHVGLLFLPLLRLFLPLLSFISILSFSICLSHILLIPPSLSAFRPAYYVLSSHMSLDPILLFLSYLAQISVLTFYSHLGVCRHTTKIAVYARTELLNKTKIN